MKLGGFSIAGEHDRVRTWSLLMIGAAAAITLAVFLYTLEFSLEDADFSLVMLVWVLSPFAGLFLIARRRGGRVCRIATLIGVSIVSILGVAVLLDAFFWHIDAQSGLVFLFVPLLQWAGVALLFVVTRLLVPK